MLELIEAPLDPVAVFVADSVVRDYDLPAPVRGDDSLSVHGLDDGAQCVAVIGFVGKNGVCRQTFKQGRRRCDVTRLASGYDKTHRAAKRVG
jgi:hypothetical protein